MHPAAPKALESAPSIASLVVTRTARELAEASIAPNTRAAYASALRRFDEWLAGRPATDETLASYLAELFTAGKSPASASMVVVAVRFRARLAGIESPTGPATERVLAGFRRKATGRGRGQAAPCTADNLAAILATAARPRTNGRGTESDETALGRGLEDSAIAALLFQGGLRRSEVAALRWADICAATAGNGLLVTVQTSKTNQNGASADIRYLKKRRRRCRPQTLSAPLTRRQRPSFRRIDATEHRQPFRRRRHGRWNRAAPNRSLGPRRARLRAHRPRRIHHRNHARWELEDGPHGRSLQRGRRRRARGR